MPRNRCSFRESDVRRAVKAARSSGLEIGRVEIDSTNGKIAILPERASFQAQHSELDGWLTKHARQA